MWPIRYHPYGSTAWWAEKSGIQVSRKRYRYIGKERDEETGLQCHGVGYYAVWLGRWTSADPIGLGDGVNRFGYCHGNPCTGRDLSGLGEVKQGGGYVDSRDEAAGRSVGLTPPEDTVAGYLPGYGYVLNMPRSEYEAAAQNSRFAREQATTEDTSGFLGALSILVARWFTDDPQKFGAVGDQFRSFDDVVLAHQYETDIRPGEPVPGKGIAKPSPATPRVPLSEPRAPGQTEGSVSGWPSPGTVRESSPIGIPSSAVFEAVPQQKVGYAQIRFRWESGGYKIEARWHTRTPGAPEGQGDTWVVTRTRPGTATGQSAITEVLTGVAWTPAKDWYEAIAANQRGTATPAQRALLQAGHHPAAVRPQ